MNQRASTRVNAERALTQNVIFAVIFAASAAFIFIFFQKNYKMNQRASTQNAR